MRPSLNTATEDAGQPAAHTSEKLGRSVLKTISYRLMIMALDFLTIYLFTHKVSVAVGFTIASNIYTTVAYFVHERIWNKVRWGKRPEVG